MINSYMNNTKICRKCQDEKPLESFQINKANKNDGYAWICKKCMAVQFQQTKNQTKERRKDARRRSYLTHRSTIIQQAVKYRKQRLSTDPKYRSIKNLRGRVRAALKGILKSDKTMELIGCTPVELHQYLEKQFKDGMSWSNYGSTGWCIDHIVPCSAYDLSDPIEQKQCFHYTNLQPMWSKDNFSKSDKWVV